MLLWGGGSSHVLFSRCFLLPLSLSVSPPRLPHRGDLDLEECAPCSVSGENRGGRGRNSSGSLTHFSIPPTRFCFLRRLCVESWNETFFFFLFCRRVTGSAEASCFWMFAESLVIILPSFYKRQHEKFPARAFFFSVLTSLCTKHITKMNPVNQICI